MTGNPDDSDSKSGVTRPIMVMLVPAITLALIALVGAVYVSTDNSHTSPDNWGPLFTPADIAPILAIGVPLSFLVNLVIWFLSADRPVWLRNTLYVQAVPAIFALVMQPIWNAVLDKQRTASAQQMKAIAAAIARDDLPPFKRRMRPARIISRAVRGLTAIPRTGAIRAICPRRSKAGRGASPRN